MHLPAVYARLHKYHHFYKSPEPFDDLVGSRCGAPALPTALAARFPTTTTQLVCTTARVAVGPLAGS